jgi:hypothetical protein
VWWMCMVAAASSSISSGLLPFHATCWWFFSLQYHIITSCYYIFMEISIRFILVDKSGNMVFVDDTTSRLIFLNIKHVFLFFVAV